MARVGTFAGHPARLSSGIDSAGNTCGQKNSWNNASGPDLTDYKKLYYLDPLELLDPNTFLAARSVCVQSCPGSESLCSLGALPCRNTAEYRCSAQHSLVLTIPHHHR